MSEEWPFEGDGGRVTSKRIGHHNVNVGSQLVDGKMALPEGLRTKPVVEPKPCRSPIINIELGSESEGRLNGLDVVPKRRSLRL